MPSQAQHSNHHHYLLETYQPGARQHASIYVLTLAHPVCPLQQLSVQTRKCLEGTLFMLTTIPLLTCIYHTILATHTGILLMLSIFHLQFTWAARAERLPSLAQEREVGLWDEECKWDGDCYGGEIELVRMYSFHRRPS